MRTVLDRIQDIKIVTITPSIIAASNINADVTERINLGADAVKNIVIIDINVGNLPLQGTKTLVRIAINLSRGESIIRQPVTPAALQPKPMHIVSACLPQAPARLKYLSRLNAILGRYPRSSSNVNKGKNIAIGGSITEITHASTLNIPLTAISLITSLQ